MRTKMPRNTHISDKTTSTLAKAGEGQAALPQLCGVSLRPSWSPLTEDSMPILTRTPSLDTRAVRHPYSLRDS